MAITWPTGHSMLRRDVGRVVFGAHRWFASGSGQLRRRAVAGFVPRPAARAAGWSRQCSQQVFGAPGRHPIFFTSLPCFKPPNFLSSFLPAVLHSCLLTFLPSYLPTFPPTTPHAALSPALSLCVPLEPSMLYMHTAQEIYGQGRYCRQQPSPAASPPHPRLYRRPGPIAAWVVRCTLVVEGGWRDEPGSLAVGQACPGVHLWSACGRGHQRQRMAAGSVLLAVSRIQGPKFLLRR